MMISATALSVMIVIALSITMISPIVLLILYFRDRRKGQLW